jgi:hypothetical protein
LENIGKVTVNPLIIDLEKLFLYSGLLDSIRDTSRLIYEKGIPTESNLETMVTQYSQLRLELAKVVHPDLTSEVLSWAPELDPKLVSIDSLVFASTQLSRFLDLVHQSPSFLLAQVVQEANAKQIKDKLAIENPEPEPELGLDLGNHSIGQYL